MSKWTETGTVYTKQISLDLIRSGGFYNGIIRVSVRWIISLHTEVTVMKILTKRLAVILTFALVGTMLCSCKSETPKVTDTESTKLYQTPMEALELSPEDSPEWVVQLAESTGATNQIFVIAAHEKTTAWVSLHEKDANGKWKMIMTTPGYIGMNGLGKTKEGDGMTPVGTFTFNRAFGIADDPGCAIPYVKADDDTYWSGDTADGMHYNELVSLKDLPNLNKDDSEHIVDYVYEYQYCLNISYNDSGTPGAGSAIFLHCLGNRKPRTGGCVAIPMEQMYYVMQHVSPDCIVVIDSMDNLGATF